MNYKNLSLAITLIFMTSYKIHPMFTRTTIQQFTNKKHIPLLLGRLYHQLYSYQPNSTTMSITDLKNHNDPLVHKIKVGKQSVFFSKCLYIKEIHPSIYQLLSESSLQLFVINPEQDKTILPKKITFHPNLTKTVLTEEGKIFLINKKGEIFYNYRYPQTKDEYEKNLKYLLYK